MNHILWVFDTVFLFFLTKKETTTYDWVIIKTDAVGDFFIALPYMRAFCEAQRHQQKSVYIVGNSAWIQVANEMLKPNCFMEINRLTLYKNPAYRIKKMISIRAFKAENALYWSTSPEVGSGLSILRWTDAPAKFAPQNDGVIDGHFLFKTTFFEPLYLNTSRHEFFNQAYILDFFRVKNEISTFYDKPKKPRVVLFPGARLPYRVWPIQNWGKLVAWLAENTHVEVWLAGSSDERIMAKQIIELAQLPETLHKRVHNSCGDLSLRDTLELVSTSALVIGNESAGIHMAAFSKVPSICLLGGGHFNRFVPYPDDHAFMHVCYPTAVYVKMPCFHCNWHCSLQSDMSYTVPCIQQIPLDQVLYEVQKQLRYPKSEE